MLQAQNELFFMCTVKYKRNSDPLFIHSDTVDNKSKIQILSKLNTLRELHCKTYSNKNVTDADADIDAEIPMSTFPFPFLNELIIGLGNEKLTLS